MSAPETPRAASAAAEAPTATVRPGNVREVPRFGTIVVIGGGCYGSYYLRQLTRARDAGAVEYDRILVVDRDPDCRVATAAASDYAESTAGGPPRREGGTDWRIAPHHFAAIRVEIAAWEQFLPAYFDAACAEPSRFAGDAVVPSPLMPHLAHQWLSGRARVRWPGRAVGAPPLDVAPSTPWQRAATDSGTHYVSFATWMCPINCVEPARCPETRGPRSWSMPVAARSYAEAAAARGRPLVGPLLFHCEHRAYGVGMFDTRAAMDADATLGAAVAGAAPGETVRALVASVSHCHGAWSVLEIGPGA